MAEAEPASATQVPAAEEEKKHDVEYADEEAKNSVSITDIWKRSLIVNKEKNWKSSKLSKRPTKKKVLYQSLTRSSPLT